MKEYSNFQKGIGIIPKDTNESNLKGEIEVVGDKAFLHNGTINDPIVTENTSATLTNKSISGVTNDISSIPNTSLDFSSITINGIEVELGNSIVVSASTIHELTFGLGLLPGSFDGAAPVTVSVDSNSVPLLDSVNTFTKANIFNRSIVLPVGNNTEDFSGAIISNPYTRFTNPGLTSLSSFTSSVLPDEVNGCVIFIQNCTGGEILVENENGSPPDQGIVS